MWLPVISASRSIRNQNSRPPQPGSFYIQLKSAMDRQECLSYYNGSVSINVAVTETNKVAEILESLGVEPINSGACGGDWLTAPAGHYSRLWKRCTDASHSQHSERKAGSATMSRLAISSEKRQGMR